MAVFSSKIIAGVIAGGFTLGGAGLLFTGTEQLQDASNFVNEAKNKIVQYENAENSLLSKLGLVRTEANGKIQSANTVIADKNAEITQKLAEIESLNSTKAQLESDIAGLRTEISDLQASLDQSNADHEATKGLLAEKTAAYNAKVAELDTANARIAEYIRLAQIAYEKAQEADGHIVELEAEVQEANAAVDAHDAVVDQAKADTSDKAPMTNDELGAVETSTENVSEAPAVEEPVEAPAE